MKEDNRWLTGPNLIRILTRMNVFISFIPDTADNRLPRLLLSDACVSMTRMIANS